EGTTRAFSRGTGKSLSFNRRGWEAQDCQGQGEQERSFRRCACACDVQQHDRYDYRLERQRDWVVKRRESRLQRLAQKHCLRSANGGAGCLAPGNGPWPKGGGGARERPWSWTRVCSARVAGYWTRSHSDS